MAECPRCGSRMVAHRIDWPKGKLLARCHRCGHEEPHEPPPLPLLGAPVAT